MWQSLSLVLVLSCSVVQSRITFATSEVLDTVDLEGALATATFRCYAGCRVYSPTTNDKIVIVDSTGKEYKSLLDLSTLKMGESYELQPNAALYKLKNKGDPNPKFVFYAVEKGAMHYMSPVAYTDTGKYTTIGAKNDQIVTVMSASGAVHFSSFQGDFTGALPTVHATPFDSISTCRAVYTASAAFSPANTVFPVYSPIATVNFKKNSANTVLVSGDSGKTVSGEDSSAVYVSPGYVGCSSTGDSLYTFLPRVVSVDDYVFLKNSNGLSSAVNGDYSIFDQKNALKVTINDAVVPMTGKNGFSKTYDGTSFKFQISWNYIEGGKDRFALQVDVATEKVGPGPVATTPKVGPGPGPGPAQTSPRPISTTSTTAQPLALLSSCLVVVLFFLSSW